MSKVKAWGTTQNPPPSNPFRPRNVLLAGGAMLLASLLVGCNITDDKKHDDTPTPDASSESPSHKGNNDRIPYNTHVDVTCYVTNNSGQYTSVNALYHIKGGKWDGGWVPANVMLNDPSAKVGDTTTPALDARVPACK